MVNIVEFTKFISKVGLTANQFLLCYLIMLPRYDLLYQYIEGIRKNNPQLNNKYGGIPRYEIDDLEDRGFIAQIASDSKYADNYMVLDKFTKHFKTIDSVDAIEFWNAYPERISNETTSWRGRNMNKDAFIVYYTNLIGHDKELHELIMKTIKYEKAKGILKEGMQKWLERRPWETFDEKAVNLKRDLV
jgi:hypothetical protein